jgi:hypothetical protein
VAVSSGVASVDSARSARGTESASVTAAASTAVALAAPSVSARPADVPVAQPPVSDTPPAVPDAGVLQTPARARQHRIFLDGREIGEGPGEYVVPCGPHKVRIGSRGEEKGIEVPCGGTAHVE